VKQLLVLAAFASASSTSAASPAPIAEHEARVTGVTLHYLVAGHGTPIVLLHGYAETSDMWRPVIEHLSHDHVVIAPDLRGTGGSSKPESGYDKVTLAADVHDLVRSLGYRHVQIVGHDIGMMVAYAYAAKYSDETDTLTLMDAVLPGIGSWQAVWQRADKWHFHFRGPTAERLVAGRERIYLDHFWNDFAADPARSVPEAQRQLYARAYAQPGAMHASFEYFHAFEQDAADFTALSKTKLPMPVLVLAGEKAAGTFLINQARLVATNVHGVVISGAGHWLLEEAPAQTIDELVAFL